MKREILFKAKMWISGEWLYGEVHLKCNNAHIHTNYRDSYKIDEDTVCQFTGMADKNGTKIFEGDVLETEEGLIWVVSWSEKGEWIACDVLYEDTELLYDIVCDNIRVVGNRFDNKELLK